MFQLRISDVSVIISGFNIWVAQSFEKCSFKSATIFPFYRESFAQSVQSEFRA